MVDFFQRLRDTGGVPQGLWREIDFHVGRRAAQSLAGTGSDAAIRLLARVGRGVAGLGVDRSPRSGAVGAAGKEVDGTITTIRAICTIRISYARYSLTRAYCLAEESGFSR